MTASDLPETSPTPAGQLVVPMAAQVLRRERRRRFNRWFVYLPLALGVLLWLGLIVWISWYSFAPATAENGRRLASALADIVLIVTLLPLLLLCAAPPAAAVGLFFYLRQRDEPVDGGPRPVGNALLRLFWRVEMLIDRVYGVLSRLSERVAAPVIRLGGRLAQWRAFLDRIR